MARKTTEATEEKRPVGRPSSYTPEIAAAICERLAAGQSLRAICRDDDMPAEATVRKWAVEDVNGFSAQYTRSRDIGLDAIADDVFEIADNERGDPTRDRLRFDARRWYLSKLAPKKYGDKVTNEHSGPDGGAIQKEVRHTFDLTGLTDDELDQLERLTEKAAGASVD